MVGADFFLHFQNMVLSFESKVTVSGLRSASLGRNIKYLCIATSGKCVVIWSHPSSFGMNYPSPVAGNEDAHALRNLPSLAAALQLSHQHKRRAYPLPLPATWPVLSLDWKIMCFTASVLYVNVKVSMPGAWHTCLNLCSLQESQQWPLLHDCIQTASSV